MLPSLRIPIIQAPMLGASTTEMAAAVCRAGGLGSLAPGLGPAALTQAVEGLRRATDRPFAVNLFVLDPVRPDEGQVAAAVTSALGRLALMAGLPGVAAPLIADPAAKGVALSKHAGGPVARSRAIPTRRRCAPPGRRPAAPGPLRRASRLCLVPPDGRRLRGHGRPGYSDRAANPRHRGAGAAARQ